MTIRESDIMSDGAVRLYRQREDLPFTAENLVTIKAPFASLARMPMAFASAFKKEAEAASVHSYAWNPEFGYVTARPDICGTGLEISALFHLEGLHLIGDLNPVLNAFTALRLEAKGCSGGGMRDAAHLFRLKNIYQLGLDEQDLLTRVSRVFADLVSQESNARIRLVTEFPRVFEDAIERSLAILRACRLISEWELLDIVSPLRIAAELSFLDHFTRDEALSITRERISLPDPFAYAPGTYEEQKERDAHDALLADKVNKRFRNVKLSARGKDYLS